MNLSLSDFNLPFFASSYCVFPADAMMRHLSACPLLVLFFLFTKTLPSLRCTMMTPKSSEAGIWLPLALNKQLLSDSHGCTAVARGGTPTGKSPRRTGTVVGGWMRRCGRQKIGTFGPRPDWGRCRVERWSVVQMRTKNATLK